MYKSLLVAASLCAFTSVNAANYSCTMSDLSYRSGEGYHHNRGYYGHNAGYYGRGAHHYRDHSGYYGSGAHQYRDHSGYYGRGANYYPDNSGYYGYSQEGSDSGTQMRVIIGSEEGQYLGRQSENHLDSREGSVNDRNSYINPDAKTYSYRDSEKGELSYNTTPNKQGSYDNDRDLMNQIRMALEGNGSVHEYQYVNVNVYNGVVTLTGHVANRQIKEEVKNRIERMDGVKKIDDKLEVTSSSNDLNSGYAGDRTNNYSPKEAMMGSADQDHKINKDLQDVIEGGFFSDGYKNVTFDVKNGHVVLKGTVKNDGDKKDLIEKVKKIDAVKSVDDQVMVVKSN